MQIENELKDCPNCHTLTYVYILREENKKFFVYCHNCRRQTKLYDAIEEAIQEWNRAEDYTIVDIDRIRSIVADYVDDTTEEILDELKPQIKKKIKRDLVKMLEG
jgi:hypothetical protein